MKAKFYQVGGSVRDELLGLESKDLDYAVETSSFSGMRDAILERGGELFLESPQYFTIRARVPGLGACDFVLCRKEGAYSDGRHPASVERGTIYDDLARRDFTINAIAKAEDGTLLDPHNGQADLESRLLFCVGDPRERFSEDGLRMLRAIRFAITKELTITPEIEELLQNEDFFIPRLAGVSIERIREELHKCFAYDTQATLIELIWFADLRRHLFSLKGLWLKPTTGER